MNLQRESIFITALRTFCRIFFGVVAFFLALIVVALFYNSVSGTTTSIESKTKVKYLPDAENKREIVASTAPVILQLNVHGVIGGPKGIDTNSVQNVLIESRTDTLKDNRVKGILLHMNTPGGTVVDADNIYRMLKDYKEKYKVPVFAYVDGLCASGGMYMRS
jgi:protease-4